MFLIYQKLIKKRYQTCISFQSKLHQKIHRHNVDFSSIEIRSKKVHGNDVYISLIEITSKKVRQNHVDFSAIEIISKKYVEMAWKFINIFFSTYRRNTDSNRRRFYVLCCCLVTFTKSLLRWLTNLSSIDSRYEWREMTH